MSTAPKPPVQPQGKKKFVVFGFLDGQKVEVVVEGDPQIGDSTSGKDLKTGAQVSFTIKGRNIAI